MSATATQVAFDSTGKVIFNSEGKVTFGCVCQYHYYVNSTSGNVAETGSGTEVDPWVNANTPFNSTIGQGTLIWYYVNTMGCNITIHVTGTVDYVVTVVGTRNYNNLLSVVPWGEGRITITTGTTCVHRLSGCNFLNVDVVASGTGASIGFSLCNYSVFNNCTATVSSSSSANESIAFTGCQYSSFVSCTATATSTNYRASGFGGCDSSSFDTCSTNVTSGYRSYGFYYNYNSTFESCDATVSVVETKPRIACGFYDNVGSEFVGCSTTGDFNCPGSDI